MRPLVHRRDQPDHRRDPGLYPGNGQHIGQTRQLVDDAWRGEEMARSLAADPGQFGEGDGDGHDIRRSTEEISVLLIGQPFDGRVGEMSPCFTASREEPRVPEASSRPSEDMQAMTARHGGGHAQQVDNSSVIVSSVDR